MVEPEEVDLELPLYELTGVQFSRQILEGCWIWTFLCIHVHHMMGGWMLVVYLGTLFFEVVTRQILWSVASIFKPRLSLAREEQPTSN